MVSIIILSYNTKGLLEKCLTSIFTKIKDIDFEVIVVDNASSDDSVKMIKEKFAKAKLVESKENLGFAKGVNVGASHAKGKYLLLLNSDIEVITPEFKELFGSLEKNDDIAVVGGKLDNADGSTSRSYGAFYELGEVFRMLFRDTEKKTLDEPENKPFTVDWVSGGFMAIKKSVFDELRGLDPHFFMYIEDMEFCYRVQKKGLKVLYNPGVVVKHVGQGSSNRAFAIINIYKGILYFYKKHMPKWQYYMVKFFLITKAVSAILFGLVTNNAYLKDTYTKAIKF
jgi:GT2 family glycosyltransferase